MHIKLGFMTERIAIDDFARKLSQKFVSESLKDAPNLPRFWKRVKRVKLKLRPFLFYFILFFFGGGGGDKQRPALNKVVWSVLSVIKQS